MRKIYITNLGLNIYEGKDKECAKNNSLFHDEGEDYF